MPDVIYEREDIAYNGWEKVFEKGTATINGKAYTLVNRKGKPVKRYVHSAITDPDVLFVPKGEPCDLVDDRYLEPYRSMGREAFLEMTRQNPAITPQKAMAIATRVQIERKFSILKQS